MAVLNVLAVLFLVRLDILAVSSRTAITPVKSIVNIVSRTGWQGRLVCNQNTNHIVAEH